MNVYSVVLNEMLTGVVPSQVLAPARAWARLLGISPSIVFLEPARVAFSRPARRRLAELRELWADGGTPPGRIHLCPYVGRLGDGSPGLSLATFLRLRRPPGRLVLHCRGPEATLQAVQVVGRTARVIFDARGAGAPEARLRLAAAGSDDRDLATRSALAEASRERRATGAADAISVVSTALARRLSEFIDPDDERPLEVIPCCVSGPTFDPAARETARAQLGIAPEEILLVHLSTAARWEDYPQVHALFREVAARRPTRLLFLTSLSEAEVTRGIPGDDPLRRAVLVRQAAPGEVPGLLAAADAGLLLRQPHEAFRVASPIKFAEYLAAGLPVVASASVSAVEEVIAQRAVGIVVPAPAEAAALAQAAGRLLALLETPEAARERALAACRDLYTWERYASEAARLYGLSAGDDHGPLRAAGRGPSELPADLTADFVTADRPPAAEATP